MAPCYGRYECPLIGLSGCLVRLVNGKLTRAIFQLIFPSILCSAVSVGGRGHSLKKRQRHASLDHQPRYTGSINPAIFQCKKGCTILLEGHGIVRRTHQITSQYDVLPPGNDDGDVFPKNSRKILPWVETRAAIHIVTPQRGHTVSTYRVSAFLHTLGQFAGDPSRGFEVPPVTATFTCLSGSSQRQADPVQLTSDTVLLLPPLPDLSMPVEVQ